jgi:hypothetical protein
VELESRDVDMLLDNRRSHDCGTSGVFSRSGSIGRGSVSLSIAISILACGVNALFCPILALLERAFPSGPSLIDRAEGGVESVKGEVRFEGGHAATAVISRFAGEGLREES